MEPPSPPRPALSLDSEAFGEPQPWAVKNRGLEYLGEVIVAEAVDPIWGTPLPNNLTFQIVLFKVPRRIPAGLIQDRRIAMAVPRRFPEQIRYLDRELRAIRETSERYLTAGDSSPPMFRGAMHEREESLRRETERGYAPSYAQGRIYTHADIEVRAADVFVEDTATSWADRLVSAVLQQAHPTLPIDYDGFPSILNDDRVQTLYRALFQGDADAEGLLPAFGPGLGITAKDAPRLFDAGECRAVLAIMEQLESRGDEAPTSDILMTLTQSLGLTPALAALFLMVCVRHNRVEIELRRGHSVPSPSGRVFVGDQVTWDLIPEVSFSAPLVEDFVTLRTRTRPSWNTVLHYASLVLSTLTPGDDPKTTEEQERRLLAALREMPQQIAAAREAVTELAALLGDMPPKTRDLASLELLCGISNFREFYDVAQDRFSGPPGLGDALDLLDRLQRLAEIAPAITEVKLYLDRMTFGPSHSKLSMEHRQVVGRIELEGVVTNPSLWGSIEGGFRRLREHYVEAYAQHHSAYHDESAAMSNGLKTLGLQGDALARFGEMPELGEPIGGEASVMLGDISDSLRTCAATEDTLSLEATPYCGDRLLPLNEDVPRRDFERLRGIVEGAMGEYNRRLSSISVRRVLASPTSEQLDKFIDLLHVADPSALANVLDDSVVEFLRGFLREGDGPAP